MVFSRESERCGFNLPSVGLMVAFLVLFSSSSWSDYRPVNPCRIVDTRFGDGGVMDAGETRAFRVHGVIRDQNQAVGNPPDDYPDSCPSPVAGSDLTAAHINVTVVPRGSVGEGGWVAVWPWGTTKPNASWLNYVAGTQNVANAGTVAITVDGGNPHISVQTLRTAHVIIDVMGYFY